MLQNLKQTEMFELSEHPVQRSVKKTQRSGSFTDNMKLPVHRWFRYSAGFSGEWAQEVIASRKFDRKQTVFDPFAGSGTTLLAAQRQGVASVGVEHHRFVHRVAEAKLCWAESEQGLIETAEALLKQAIAIVAKTSLPDSKLLQRCYSPDVLRKLEALKTAFLTLNATDGHLNLVWLAITSILRECSGVGTAQWQYLLPNKSKQRISDPFVAFKTKIRAFAEDMALQKQAIENVPYIQMLFGDARDSSVTQHLNGRVRLILTSPPYPNNYDYADATRLEMTFWGEVKSWSDLHDAIRFRLITSCSQHSAAEKLKLADLLRAPEIAPIRKELSIVCSELESTREVRAGKKTYHTMVAAYFIDLAKVWNALRPLSDVHGEACFVIGDSAPYGIYVPVDEWLGKLALAAGYKSFRFEKLRDRNMKWKNRKHRVPLKEGMLWVSADG